MGVSVETSPSIVSSVGGGGGGGGGTGWASVLDFFGDAGSPSSSRFLFNSGPDESVGEVALSPDNAPIVPASSVSNPNRGVSGVAVSKPIDASPFDSVLFRDALFFSRSVFFLTALSMKSLTKDFTVFSCFELIGAVGSLTRWALKSPRTNFFVT